MAGGFGLPAGGLGFPGLAGRAGFFPGFFAGFFAGFLAGFLAGFFCSFCHIFLFSATF